MARVDIPKGKFKTGNKLIGYTFFSLKKDFGKGGYPYITFSSLAKAKKEGYNTAKLNWVRTLPYSRRSMI